MRLDYNIAFLFTMYIYIPTRNTEELDSLEGFLESRKI